jgi:hypothetical protein
MELFLKLLVATIIIIVCFAIIIISVMIDLPRITDMIIPFATGLFANIIGRKIFTKINKKYRGEKQ